MTDFEKLNDDEVIMLLEAYAKDALVYKLSELTGEDLDLIRNSLLFHVIEFVKGMNHREAEIAISVLRSAYVMGKENGIYETFGQ